MIIDKYYAIRIFACKKLITAQNAQNGGNKFHKSYRAFVKQVSKSLETGWQMHRFCYYI